MSKVSKSAMIEMLNTVLCELKCPAEDVDGIIRRLAPQTRRYRAMVPLTSLLNPDFKVRDYVVTRVANELARYVADLLLYDLARKPNGTYDTDPCTGTASYTAEVIAFTPEMLRKYTSDVIAAAR